MAETYIGEFSEDLIKNWGDTFLIVGESKPRDPIEVANEKIAALEKELSAYKASYAHSEERFQWLRKAMQLDYGASDEEIKERCGAVSGILSGIYHFAKAAIPQNEY